MPDRNWGQFREVARSGLIAAFLLVAPQAPSHADVASNQQTIPQGEGAHRPQPSTPPPQDAEAIQGNDRNSADKSASHEKQWSIAEVVQAGSAVASAAATIAIAGFAAWQICIYRRQTRVMDLTFRAARRANRATVRSAKAAENAVIKSDEILTHAQESSVQELRAYVFLEACNFIFDNDSITVTLKFTNAGQTPAYKAKIYGNLTKVFWPISDYMPIARDNPEVSDEPIGPKMQRFKYETTPISRNEVTGLKAGSLAIVVWGVVDYFDAFGKERHTYYRYFTGGPVGLRALTDKDGNVLAYGMSAHQKGNNAD